MILQYVFYKNFRKYDMQSNSQNCGSQHLHLLACS